MDGFRGALARYLLVAALAYAAIHLVAMAVSAHPPSALLAAILAVDPGLHLAGPGNEGLLALMGALDIPAFFAMAAAPFLLYAAAARAVAPGAPFPHPAVARALRAALAPVRAWLDACDGAVERASMRATPRAALGALAIGACVAHAAIFLVDMLAISVGHPAPPLDPLYAKLYAALAALFPDPQAHLALFDALNTLAYLAALAAMPLLANVIAMAAAPWRAHRGRAA